MLKISGAEKKILINYITILEKEYKIYFTLIYQSILLVDWMLKYSFFYRRFSLILKKSLF